MSIYDIAIPTAAELPSGYRYGAHTSRPGSEGYYIIRESDGAACVAQVRPDLDAPVTAAELDEAIASAARETAEAIAITVRLEERALDSLGDDR